MAISTRVVAHLWSGDCCCASGLLFSIFPSQLPDSNSTGKTQNQRKNAWDTKSGLFFYINWNFLTSHAASGWWFRLWCSCFKTHSEWYQSSKHSDQSQRHASRQYFNLRQYFNFYFYFEKFDENRSVKKEEYANYYFVVFIYGFNYCLSNQFKILLPIRLIS